MLGRRLLVGDIRDSIDRAATAIEGTGRAHTHLSLEVARAVSLLGQFGAALPVFLEGLEAGFRWFLSREGIHVPHVMPSVTQGGSAHAHYHGLPKRPTPRGEGVKLHEVVDPEALRRACDDVRRACDKGEQEPANELEAARLKAAGFDPSRALEWGAALAADRWSKASSSARSEAAHSGVEGAVEGAAGWSEAAIKEARKVADELAGTFVRCEATHAGARCVRLAGHEREAGDPGHLSTEDLG